MKNKLQIFLITYNRKSYLNRTLEQILAENSPIKDFSIVILDNASTDGSSELIEEYCQKYPNLTHIRHKVNIGGNANICRAFEMGVSSGKEYVWVLCDDDKYDWSNWGEVEKAVQEEKDIICTANYAFLTSADKTNPIYQIFQLTFVPAGIFKTSLFEDSVIINTYDSIIFMFPQCCVTINAINNNAEIYVLSKPIVFNGIHFQDRTKDISYTRGSKNSFITERKQKTTWILGYLSVLSLLKDSELFSKSLEVAILNKDIFGSWNSFYKHIKDWYFNSNNFNYFYEIYRALPSEKKVEFINSLNHNDKKLLNLLDKLEVSDGTDFGVVRNITFWQKIFSVKNQDDFKVLRILGLSFKFKRK